MSAEAFAAEGSKAFLPQGAFNMAVSSASGALYVRSTDGDKEVLRATFTVPAGQRADIAAFFNAEGYKYPNGYCYLKFNLDAIGPADLRPGKMWVADGYIFKGGYPTISANGYKTSVPAGAHTLIVTMSNTGGDCYVSDRSLILISNRHA